MGKKIFLFADGTGNAYSNQESNVWRLYQALDTSTNDVVAKYIPGVGTSSFKPWAMFDAATGIGVPSNVRELYGFLCDECAHGTEIYMFGFSRGAFTIRTLIGLIASEGLVTRTQDDQLGGSAEVFSTEMAKYRLAAWRNYRAKVADSWPWWQRPLFVHVARTIRKIRQLFYRSRYDKPRVEKATIKFVGLFDTVEAFGVPIEEMRIAIDRVFWPISFRNSKMSAIAQNVRHALSLDDERTSFHPLRIQPEDGEAPEHARNRIHEVWFAGVHSDVGGGYPDGNLSYVPLIWMVDELKKLEGVDSFRQEQVKCWRDHLSPYAPRHDSRSTVAVLYRYAPRNAEPLGPSGKPLAPVVHHSVVERMAFGYDRYAPTPLSAMAQVWLPTGDISEIRSPGGQLPKNIDRGLESSCDGVFKALKALDGPDEKLIDSARDRIWRRRIGYFAMLAGLGAFLALPYYADPLSNWLCDKVGQYYLVRLWLDCWQGVGRGLGPIVGAIVPNVAGYIGPYLSAMREHPALFFSLVALLIWLYGRGASIAEDIVELTNKAWMMERGDSAPASGDDSKGLVRRLRTNWLVVFLHRTGASFAMPAIWAVVLALAAAALVSRLVYEFDAGTNWTNMCVVTKDPRSVPESAVVEANSLFETKNPCWASGLEVEKGQRYRMTLTIEEPWLDRTVLTDARGFEPPGPLAEPAFFLAQPYLRWPFDPWFRPIVRIIGKYGDDEGPVNFGDGFAPSLFVDGKCAGFARRYERSPEYCQTHGYVTDEECARHPLQFGLSEPLPQGERPTAKIAFENALARSTEPPGCPAASRARKVFTANFIAARSGELFLFVNDAMPILGYFAPFYANNLGTARIALQHTGPIIDPGVAATQERAPTEGIDETATVSSE